MKALQQVKFKTCQLARRSLAALLAAFALALASTGSLAQSAAGTEQTFNWAPNFPIGSSIPDLTSLDQNTQTQDFNSLKGERGLLFLLSRSFDW